MNSKFLNFSTCGSIFSNQYGYMSGAASNIPVPSYLSNSEFSDPIYSKYHYIYEAAKLAYYFDG